MLIFFGLAYYGLSKEESRKEHMNDSLLLGKEKEDGASLGGVGDGAAAGAVVEGASGGGTHSANNAGTSNSATTNHGESYHAAATPPVVTTTRDIPQSFDPFNLHSTPNSLLHNHVNDWFGAPFAVSPPELPIVENGKDGTLGKDDVDGSTSRLGYFQYPTIVNGTLVFSSEGDLYLTRLPSTLVPDSIMPAMKLTTTIGNALHPKLNPKYPHLLAYSATYSGVREVYFLDLRGAGATSSSDSSNGGTTITGVPGAPGGSALRLTYTPGGMYSVVGWDEEGTSILYSAGSRDVALPDTRLFRLRLSSGVVKAEAIKAGGISGEKVEAKEKKADGGSTAASETADATLNTAKPKDDDDDDYSITEAQNYVDNLAPDQLEGERPEDDDDATTDKKADDATRRTLQHQERQRRHLAKLSSLSEQARRGSVGSTNASVRPIVEPIPLAQATEGVYHTTEDSECIYFTRFKQTSNTKRYVGGTAESLWAYCSGRFDDLAIPLTSDFDGTSKSPSVYRYDDGDMLLFMSDRSAFTEPDKNGKQSSATTEWVASSMNLWAAHLPVTSSGFTTLPVRLTSVSCEFNGIDLSEYSIDSASGDVILRIGADLHRVSSESIKDRLSVMKSSAEPVASRQLPIAVYSDFSNMQERLIPMEITRHLTDLDAFETSYGTITTLLTARGQTFAAPVIPDIALIPQTAYGGGGRNMPARKYRVAPGSGGGGLVRILCTKHIPQPAQTSTPLESGERYALLLATDPLSPTAEHAFYLIRTDPMASPAFGFAALYEHGDIVDNTGLPAPFLGGHLDSGGSVREGGLGSVYPDTVSVSPCGRRAAWIDTDGRIVVITIPLQSTVEVDEERRLGEVDVVVLPRHNENKQPIDGQDESSLAWSPGGRYLAIEHIAKNQFNVISIADLGSPEDGSITVGRIAQATPDRFNSYSPVWGRTSKDAIVDLYSSALDPDNYSKSGANALFFLSDRDIKLSSGATSPWGTRAPSPQFEKSSCVHVLPLQTSDVLIEENVVNSFVKAPYGGGGAMEVTMEGFFQLNALLELVESGATIVTDDANKTNATAARNQTDNASGNELALESKADEHPFIIDTEISFGSEKDDKLAFARTSYRIDSIPSGKYESIVCQLLDDPSLVVLARTPKGIGLKVFATADYPSDGVEELPLEAEPFALQYAGTSTDGKHILTLFSGRLKLIPTTATGIENFLKDPELAKNIADIDGLHLNVWPALEHQQMYKDAWRMLRDYFYDSDMTSLPWDDIFDRYLPLVERAAKREELDDGELFVMSY